MMSDQPTHHPNAITVQAGAGRYRVQGTAIATGDGVVVTLSGGEHPHVGAVGLGVPRPSLREPLRNSATSSVLAISGHKDDDLAKPLAGLFAARLGQVAVVAVGVHVDSASPEEIALLSANVRQAAEALLQSLAAPADESEGL